MKTITAREANHSFSRYLAEAEAGEEILITRNGKRVARLVSDRIEMTPEREAAVEKAIERMRNAKDLPFRKLTRDEMHER